MPNTIHTLAEQYAARFKETRHGLRLVGRELEFPLVNADGTAGDVRSLWPRLTEPGHFTPKYDDPEKQTLIVALPSEEGVYEDADGLGTEALLAALEWARSHGHSRLHVRSDSLLLVQQMLGAFKVKNPGLQPLHAKARLLAHEIGRVTFEHVGRASNTHADRLANAAMDDAAT